MRRSKLLAPGARGFNLYAGKKARAVRAGGDPRGWGGGIQISRPAGRILVRRGIATQGRVGESLVKGVVTRLPATALGIKLGGDGAREGQL